MVAGTSAAGIGSASSSGMMADKQEMGGPGYTNCGIVSCQDGLMSKFFGKGWEENEVVVALSRTSKPSSGI